MYAWDVVALRESDGSTSSLNEDAAPFCSPEPITNPFKSAREEEMEGDTSGDVLVDVRGGEKVHLKIKLRRFLLTDFESEPIWRKIGQIGDGQRPLRNVHKAHIAEFANSILRYGLTTQAA